VRCGSRAYYAHVCHYEGFVWSPRIVLSCYWTDYHSRVFPAGKPTELITFITQILANLNIDSTGKRYRLLPRRDRPGTPIRCVLLKSSTLVFRAKAKIQLTGPLVGGIMVTYASWRSILWLQVAMIGVASVLALFFIPSSRLDQGVFKLNMTGRRALAQFNPLPVFTLMAYPNVIFTVCSNTENQDRLF